MNCEMCGKEAELYTTTVEGIPLKVCERCSRHGKIIAKAKAKIFPRKIKRAAPQEPAETELIAAVQEDFAKRIRDARTKAGMTQKEFAKKINEKESILHKMETGSFTPSIPLAKKLEKILGIQLVEKREEEKVVMPKAKKGGAMTIGDILNI
jgi:putative transcription factor